MGYYKFKIRSVKKQVIPIYISKKPITVFSILGIAKKPAIIGCIGSKTSIILSFGFGFKFFII
jgi:hypothetical protein